MHTCKKCRGFSRRSSQPKNPARQRGGTLDFGNRKRGRIHEKGKSRYEDSVVHTDFVWMMFSPDEHFTKKTFSFFQLDPSFLAKIPWYSFILFLSLCRVQLDTSFSQLPTPPGCPTSTSLLIQKDSISSASRSYFLPWLPPCSDLMSPFPAIRI